MVLEIGLCLAGFVLLFFGAEWLVRGSSSLARSVGITPLVIGLTVVAFGTSAPELVVSLVSSVKGRSMIAVGNVVGSNICNIALVLGLAALFSPITSHRSVRNREIPIMLGVSLLLLVLCLDSELTRIDGAVLLAGILAYLLMNYLVARRQAAGGEGGPIGEGALEEIGYVLSRRSQILLILGGIGAVVGGAELVVSSAVTIMKTLGVDEKFIGLTVVAFGTSLPELATSVVAAVRKEMDISIGNLVGSNVFNILSVLGAAALVRPISIPGGFVESGMVVDYGVMFVTSLLPLFLLGRALTVSRRGGLTLLACYALYMAWLITRA